MTNEAKHNPQSTPNPANPETKVEKMFEYGYRKSNYGPDELVTDAHGNPISVVDAMLSAEKAAAAVSGEVITRMCFMDVILRMSRFRWSRSSRRWER